MKTSQVCRTATLFIPMASLPPWLPTFDRGQKYDFVVCKDAFKAGGQASVHRGFCPTTCTNVAIKKLHQRSSGTTPSSGAQSGPLSSGAIPPASGTPSPTTTSTTLPTDRLDAIDQALSELRASRADHDRLLVKQAGDALLLCLTLETFADEISNDIKRANDRHDVAFAALNNAISQLQNLLQAQLADKDDDLRRRTAKHNTGDSLGDARLTQSLLTAETLPTFHGKPNEDPNIFLTSFDRYATAAGWSHQDYILHFEGQLRDNADVVRRFLEQERTKGGVLLTPTEAKTQLLNCFRHRDRATAKIMKLGNLRMNVDESVDAWNLRVRTALREAFLTDFSETQVLEKFVAGAVPDLKEKFLQREDIANMADALNLARDWEGRKHAKRSLDHRSKSSRREKNNNDSSSGNDGRKKRPFCYNCKSREHWTRECSEKKRVDQSKKKDTFGGALRDTKGKSGAKARRRPRRTVLVERQDRRILSSRTRVVYRG
ncbi:hypothetical protein QOT17_008569 [Balamuthia mandrillaris]